MNAAKDYLVKPAAQKKTLKLQHYNTDNIMNLVDEVAKTDRDDTIGLARMYESSYEGLRQLFYDCVERFTYKEDPIGSQWVQTPSYLYHETKIGDCKSFTVFISTVLDNMGLTRIHRYTKYRGSGKNPKHVYPIAVLPNGRQVPMDLAYYFQEGGKFGTQKKYKFKIDHIMQGLYKLGSTAPQELPQGVSLKKLEAVMADIPDSIITDGPGDITKMTSGQVDRLIVEERFEIYAKQSTDAFKSEKYRAAARAVRQGDLSEIGSLSNDKFGRDVALFISKSARDNRPAFGTPTLQISRAAELTGFRDFLKRLGKGAKKTVKKVVKGVTNVWKKFVNWIWKGPVKAMSPFFLFQWLKGSKSREVSRRITSQKKTLNFIAKAGKFPMDKLMGRMFNSIRDRFGKNPETILKEASKPKMGSVALVASAILKAGAMVIKVVKKIISLFKKLKAKDAGDTSGKSASDLDLLAGKGDSDDSYRKSDPRTRSTADGPYEGIPPGAPGNKNTGLMAALGVAIGVGIYALN